MISSGEHAKQDNTEKVDPEDLESRPPGRGSNQTNRDGNGPGVVPEHDQETKDEKLGVRCPEKNNRRHEAICQAGDRVKSSHTPRTAQ
jgi:hypothetical protein